MEWAIVQDRLASLLGSYSVEEPAMLTRLRFAFVVLSLGWKSWLRRRRSGPLRPGWSWLQETIVAGLRYNAERLMSLSPVAGRRRIEALAEPADARKVTIVRSERHRGRDHRPVFSRWRVRLGLRGGLP